MGYRDLLTRAGDTASKAGAKIKSAIIDNWIASGISLAALAILSASAYLFPVAPWTSPSRFYSCTFHGEDCHGEILTAMNSVAPGSSMNRARGLLGSEEGAMVYGDNDIYTFNRDGLEIQVASFRNGIIGASIQLLPESTSGGENDFARIFLPRFKRVISEPAWGQRGLIQDLLSPQELESGGLRLGQSTIADVLGIDSDMEVAFESGACKVSLHRADGSATCYYSHFGVNCTDNYFSRTHKTYSFSIGQNYCNMADDDFVPATREEESSQRDDNWQTQWELYRKYAPIARIYHVHFAERDMSFWRDREIGELWE